MKVSWIYAHSAVYVENRCIRWTRIPRCVSTVNGPEKDKFLLIFCYTPLYLLLNFKLSTNTTNDDLSYKFPCMGSRAQLHPSNQLHRYTPRLLPILPIHTLHEVLRSCRTSGGNTNTLYRNQPHDSQLRTRAHILEVRVGRVDMRTVVLLIEEMPEFIELDRTGSVES